MGIVHCDVAKISDGKRLRSGQNIKLFVPLSINQKIPAYNPGMGIVHCDRAKVSDVTPKILTEHQLFFNLTKHKSEKYCL